MLFDFVRFGYQLKSHSVSAIDILPTAISDIEGFLHVIATAAKAQHQESFEFITVRTGVVHVHRRGSGFIQLNLPLREDYLLIVGRADVSRHLSFISIALKVYFAGLSSGLFVYHAVEGSPGKI